MQDLLEITHFLTRVKVAPARARLFRWRLGRGQARRRAGRETVGAVADARLADAAQGPVRSARRHAADLGLRDGADPPGLCRRSAAHRQAGADLLDGGACRASRGALRRRRRSAGAARPSHRRARPCVARRPRPSLPEGAPRSLRSLEDIAALAQANSAPVLKVHIENDMHLVRLEAGPDRIPSQRRARRAPWPAICSRNCATGPACAGRSRSPAKAARRPWPSRRSGQGGAHRKRDAGAAGARRAGPFSRRGNRGGARCRGGGGRAPAVSRYAGDDALRGPLPAPG